MEITVTYTPQLGAHIMAERVWHAAIRSWLYCAEIALMLLLAIGMLSMKLAAMNEFIMILAGGLGLFMLLDGTTVMYALYRWRTVPHLQYLRTCVFSAEGMDIVVGEEKTQTHWQECLAYRDENASFIIYTSRKGEYLTIPKQLLAAEEQDQLRNWLAKKVQKIRKVSF